MSKLEDRILDLLAEIIARFIVGFVAVYGSLWLFVRLYFDMPTRPNGWAYALVAIAAGIFYAIIGTRKGPGAI